MEEKLELFKRKRRKELFLERQRLFFQGIMTYVPGFSPVRVPKINEPLLDNSTANYEDDSDSEIGSVLSNDSTTLTFPSWLHIATYLCFFLLWLSLFVGAIHLEFGCVYFSISVLVFIVMNTRTGPRKRNEISAYSVFNPNCHAIDGTLKAEQFEREFNLIKHEA